MSRNSTTSFIRSSLRCWDSIRVQRTEAIDTSDYNFFSFDIYYNDNDVKTMRFRTRLFSTEYNQQTETELRPYDYIFKSGMVTKVFIPLTILDQKNTLQTFSIQRIEVTDKPIEFRITNITLEEQGVPTPSRDVVSVEDDKSVEESEHPSSESSSVSTWCLMVFCLLFLFLF